MDKTVKKLLTGGQKPASSLRMDLDGELVENVITEEDNHPLGVVEVDIGCCVDLSN